MTCRSASKGAVLQPFLRTSHVKSNPDNISCAFPTEFQEEMHKSHSTQLEPRLRHAASYHVVATQCSVQLLGLCVGRLAVVTHGCHTHMLAAASQHCCHGKNEWWCLLLDMDSG